jgi:hypothetical protein
MPPMPTGNPHDAQAAIAVLIAISTCFCVTYWRTVVRVLIIAAIALAVFGTVIAIEGVRSLMEPHR